MHVDGVAGLEYIAEILTDAIDGIVLHCHESASGVPSRAPRALEGR